MIFHYDLFQKDKEKQTKHIYFQNIKYNFNFIPVLLNSSNKYFLEVEHYKLEFL